MKQHPQRGGKPIPARVIRLHIEKDHAKGKQQEAVGEESQRAAFGAEGLYRKHCRNDDDRHTLDDAEILKGRRECNQAPKQQPAPDVDQSPAAAFDPCQSETDKIIDCRQARQRRDPVLCIRIPQQIDDGHQNGGIGVVGIFGKVAESVAHAQQSVNGIDDRNLPKMRRARR